MYVLCIRQKAHIFNSFSFILSITSFFFDDDAMQQLNLLFLFSIAFACGWKSGKQWRMNVDVKDIHNSFCEIKEDFLLKHSIKKIDFTKKKHLCKKKCKKEESKKSIHHVSSSTKEEASSGSVVVCSSSKWNCCAYLQENRE